MVELSIVIPCYNSSKSIEELAEKLNLVLIDMGVAYEVIFINDCSKDNSFTVIKKVVNKYSNMLLIDLMFNVGQFRALYCGLEASSGKFVVTLDDDLQHNPSDITKLYQTIKEDDDLDAVFGKPAVKEHGIVRNIGSLFIKKVNEQIFRKPKNLTMSAFRILRKELVETILAHNTMYPVFGPMVLKSTNRIINVDIEHSPRKYGKSNYSTLLLLKTTFDNIINFSSAPLQFISLFGIMASFTGLILAFIYALRYFMFDSIVSGWTTLVVLLNIYGGLILLSIGVIGEYLNRILVEVQGSPKYVIREIYKK